MYCGFFGLNIRDINIDRQWETADDKQSGNNTEQYYVKHGRQQKTKRWGQKHETEFVRRDKNA